MKSVAELIVIGEYAVQSFINGAMNDGKTHRFFLNRSEGINKTENIRREAMSHKYKYALIANYCDQAATHVIEYVKKYQDIGICAEAALYGAEVRHADGSFRWYALPHRFCFIGMNAGINSSKPFIVPIRRGMLQELGTNITLVDAWAYQVAGGVDKMKYSINAMIRDLIDVYSFHINSQYYQCKSMLSKIVPNMAFSSDSRYPLKDIGSYASGTDSNRSAYFENAFTKICIKFDKCQVPDD